MLHNLQMILHPPFTTADILWVLMDQCITKLMLWHQLKELTPTYKLLVRDCANAMQFNTRTHHTQRRQFGNVLNLYFSRFCPHDMDIWSWGYWYRHESFGCRSIHVHFDIPNTYPVLLLLQLLLMFWETTSYKLHLMCYFFEITLKSLWNLKLFLNTGLPATTTMSFIWLTFYCDDDAFASTLV